MDDFPSPIELLRLADRIAIEANVVKLTRTLAQKQIDGKWWQLPGVSTSQRQNEPDHQWRWAERIGELRNDRWHEALAVQTDDGSVQGAILYWINTKSLVDQNEPAVFVEAVATAPSNRPSLVAQPLYRGVGEGLLLTAIEHSYRLGFGGTVNLEAFNDAKLLAYYEARGFAIVGYDGDDDEEQIPQLEISSAAAIEWMKEEGYEL